MRKLWIMPSVAAIAVAAWVVREEIRIDQVERDAGDLKQRIRRAESMAEPAPRRAPGSLVEQQQTAGPGLLDWETFGTALARTRTGGMPDMRQLIRFQEQLAALEPEQLLAALEEIADAGLDPATEDMMKMTVMGMLAQSDPALLLEQSVFSDLSRSDSSSFMLSKAFAQWLETDGDAARTWFDARIAAGDFDSRALDGRSPLRMQFERAMIEALLGQGKEAVAERLDALPEEFRSEIFQSGAFMTVPPPHQLAFAELVREHVPEEQRGSVLARAAKMMVYQGGYAKVEEYLGQIEARPDERREIVQQAASGRLQAAGRLGQDVGAAVDEMRAWLGEVAPEEAGALAGRTLAEWWGAEEGERVEAVERLHAAGGGDDLLVSFLERGGMRGDPEALRQLAEKIESPERRAVAMEGLKSTGRAIQISPETSD